VVQELKELMESPPEGIEFFRRCCGAGLMAATARRRRRWQWTVVADGVIELMEAAGVDGDACAGIRVVPNDDDLSEVIAIVAGPGADCAVAGSRRESAARIVSNVRLMAVFRRGCG
jgi:hypothetical protein